ncbi:MAG TPA: NAD-dependent epimerase/dehydratase family protein [Candidatus Limnocylindrales bacterium]|nr:NAD-dependent epimerase/dehydratase family protein [Candidatus Limnocylindrales bacterium]
MRAFVTGATGLLGNNLVRALEAAGHQVVALARDPSKASRVLAGCSAEIVVGDMKRVSDFAGALSGCDAVFHTAAYFREAFEPGSDEAELDEINIGGTMKLLDAADAAAVRCFVHVSSGGTIGRKSDGSPGDESTPPLPMQRENPYFRSKLKGDAALAAWRSKNGITIVEILPGWIWGPWDAAPTGAGKLVAEFTDGKIPANIGGGTSVVDARDVAAAMIAAAVRASAPRAASAIPGASAASSSSGASAPSGTSAGAAPAIEKYIVGGCFCSMKEIMDHLAVVTGVPAPRFEIPFVVLLAYAYGCEAWGRLTGGAPLVTPLAVRTMHARISLDSSKAARELGVTFRDVAETFRDSADWQRKHREIGDRH